MFAIFQIAYKYYGTQAKRKLEISVPEKTGNIGYSKQGKNTTQYVLDTTIRKQAQIM